MMAVPVAGERVSGTSCAPLMAARNSTTWARAVKARAQIAPANSNPRTGGIFIGGEGTTKAGWTNGHATKRNNLVTIVQSSAAFERNCDGRASHPSEFSNGIAGQQTSPV